MKTRLKLVFFTLMMTFLLSTICYAAAPIAPVLGAVGIGQNVYIQPGQVENSDAVAIGGDVYVNGTVNGNAISIGGNVYVNGNVKGDVTSIGGNINLGEQGKINGKSTEIGKSFNVPLKFRDNYFRNISSYYPKKANLATFILLFVFTVIIYEIMAKNIRGIAFEAGKNVGKSLIYGYVTLIAVPITTVLLIITIIGILLVPILFLVTYVIFLIGFTSLSLYCGKRMGIAVLKKDLSDIWCLFIGAALYELIKGISFAGIGSIVSFFFVIPLSVGLALSTKFGTFKSWKRDYGDE